MCMGSCMLGGLDAGSYVVQPNKENNIAMKKYFLIINRTLTQEAVGEGGRLGELFKLFFFKTNIAIEI